MGTRRKAREAALQAIYLADVGHLPVGQALDGVLHGDAMDQTTRTFARRLALGTLERLADIDAIIARTAVNWEVGRMAALDRNILRLGAFEILAERDTPVSVVIDEAVEMAKRFSTPESGRFVNGVLDRLKGERGTTAVS